MKKIFSTIAILILTTNLFSQVSKNFIQTFSIEEGSTISLELYGDIVVQKWDNNHVRVEACVTLDNFTTYTLENLQSAGRYKLLSTNDGSNLHIFNVPTQYRIKISGIDLKEKFSYKIYVPSYSDQDNIQILFPESKEYSQNVFVPTPVN